MNKDSEGRQRRLAQNRKTAQIRCNRNLHYLDSLQIRNTELMFENKELIAKRTMLKKHHANLTSILKDTKKLVQHPAHPPRQQQERQQQRQYQQLLQQCQQQHALNLSLMLHHL